MPKTSRAGNSREKVAAHRARLRTLGLRPVQIWVPDVRAPAFRAAAQAQARAVAESAQAVEDQGFVDAISDLSADGGQDRDGATDPAG